MFKRSFENDKVVCFCWFGKRYIFIDGTYIGWYRP